MSTRLEHANLCVRDIDNMIRFLQLAFPEFTIRHDALDAHSTRWVHIGTDDTYLALNQSTQEPARRWTPYTGVPGVNHLAYEVDDVAAVHERLLGGGYTESTVENVHPHRRRIYFLDSEGNDWEFVQYLTNDPRLRHDYTLTDKL